MWSPTTDSKAALPRVKNTNDTNRDFKVFFQPHYVDIFENKHVLFQSNGEDYIAFYRECFS